MYSRPIVQCRIKNSLRHNIRLNKYYLKFISALAFNLLHKSGVCFDYLNQILVLALPMTDIHHNTYLVGCSGHDSLKR